MNNTSETSAANQRQSQKSVTWQDPTIPAGDAPPLPAWPTYITGAVWIAWIAFLAYLAATR